MTVPLGTALDNFLARYEGLRDRLPGDAAAREAAATSLRAHGLPIVRDEAWRYTNLNPLAAIAFAEPLTSVGDDLAEPAGLPDDDGYRIVLVDGHVRPDLSRIPDMITVGRFAEDPEFGSARTEPMAMLNTLLAEDGVTIDVADNVDAGTLRLISLVSGDTNRPTAIHPRHTIRLAPGARLAIFEIARGHGTYLHNPVTTIAVAEGASLTHTRLQDESHAAFHTATLYIDLATRAAYDGFTLNIGGRLARAEFHARLSGPHGTLHLNGAQLLGGERLSDFTSVVAHDAPYCASRQTVKTVLDGHARGVFQGRIEVARIAQKTDGYQMNQALLLSPHAEIDCKPELRINADDVKCSHGATIGELDAAQLFYCRSRGIPETEARAILVRAFLTEAFDAVTDDTIRDVLDQAVAAWWERQAA